MDWQVIVNNLWVLIFIIPLVWIFLKLKSKDSSGNTSLSNLAFILEFGCYIFLIILVEVYIFKSHNYFAIGCFIFIPILVAFIFWLLSKDKTYIIETCHEGNIFYDVENVKEIVIPRTSHRILIMADEVYNDKRHVGDLHYQLWQGSRRIKFCDFYDEKTGTFYHPSLNHFSNFTFYAIKGYWEKLQSDVPKLVNENMTLTLAFEWHLAQKLRGVSKNTDIFLKALNEQHKNDPFKLPETIEEIYNRKAKEKQRDILKTEKPISPEPVNNDKPEGD